MKKYLFLISAVIVSLATYAQENEAASKLTYKEAIRTALKNNLVLNQQKNNLYAAQVQKNQSITAFLPGVSAYGGAQHSEGRQPTPDGGDLVDQSANNIWGGIQAEWIVFNGLNNVNSTFRAHSQLFAQTAFVERSEQKAVADVTNQYLQVLLDQELLKIAEETFRTQEVVLSQMREQVNLGARAESDMYTQDAQVRNLQVTALRARVTLENDKALLAQMLQLDPAITFEVQPPPAPETSSYIGLNLDSLYAIGVSNRPDLMQAKYQADANKFNYRASLNGFLPRVSLFGDYSSQYNSVLRPAPGYGDFNNQFRNVFPVLNYGVRVNIPIFDRMVTRSTRTVNKMIYENSVLEQENMEKTVKIEIKRSYNNYKAAIEALEASQFQQRAGELALKTQQESMILGLVGPVELAQATQAYVQAASSKAQAEVTLAFQKMLLDYALGTLKPESFLE
jgi:outer membrane protein